MDSIEKQQLKLSFCYSYLKNDKIILRFNHAINKSAAYVLDVNIEKNFFQSNLKLCLNLSEDVECITQKQNLILDKINYAKGDTISGYLSFFGYQNTKEKVKRKLSGYFRCVVGNNEVSIDNIKNYETCFSSREKIPKRAERLALRLKEREEFKRLHN